MRIISEGRINDYCDQYPTAKTWLLAFLKIARTAEWQDLVDLRKTYRDADAVTVGSGKTVTVLNARGNGYRFVVALHYNSQRLYVLRFMTHAEYTRGAWKSKL